MRSIFNNFFNEHHVRANFYHVVAVAFLITTVLWSFDIISGTASFIIGIVLFATDWIAEMYDPHPENPGPWFESHFHRICDKKSVKAIKIILGIFIILITISIIIPSDPGVVADATELPEGTARGIMMIFR